LAAPIWDALVITKCIKIHLKISYNIKSNKVRFRKNHVIRLMCALEGMIFLSQINFAYPAVLVVLKLIIIIASEGSLLPEPSFNFRKVKKRTSQY
jgi:hypothetical protein